MGLQLTRTATVSETTFDVDSLSDEECFRQFRFLKKGLNIISSIIRWSGVTKRNRYKCSPLTAACILLRRLTYPSKWKYLEEQHSMQLSALDEVFHECLSHLVETHGHWRLHFESN